MENDIDITIVVYMGGCCGDLVTAMIDHSDVEFNFGFNKVKLTPQRQRLKKPHEFIDDRDKDNYLENISRTYKSVPSHDIEYHTSRQHRFVGITVTDTSTALWAAQRFRDTHHPRVWQSVAQARGITYVEQYAQLLLDYGSMIRDRSDRLIDAKAIRQGELLPHLEQVLNCKLDSETQHFYRNWLDMQSGRKISQQC